MQTRTHYRCLIVVGAMAVAGCGGSVARITGTVSHNGEPVRAADVVVESTADAAQQFFGVTTDDGSLYVGYRDKPGLAPGAWKIRVTQYTLRNGQPLPGGEAGQAIRTSGHVVAKTYLFEQELTGGQNTLELKLEAAASTADASTAQ
jgi:hypothetical protein